MKISQNLSALQKSFGKYSAFLKHFFFIFQTFPPVDSFTPIKQQGYS